MKKVLFSFLIILCTFSLIGCGKKEEEVKEKEQEPENPIGYVEKDTVENLVDQFNALVLDTSGLGPADKESLTTKGGLYWYSIDDNIYLVVNPLDALKDPKEDIVSSMRIYFTEKTKEDPQIPVFTRLLIMANNKDISREEADKLISESKDVANDNLTSNNGKGISVGYAETDDHYEYQIIRNYKE